MTIIKRNNMLSLNNNINDINTEEFNTIKAHCLIVYHKNNIYVI